MNLNLMLATVEPILFWAGLAAFLTSLVVYGMRTRDWPAIFRFWEPLITFNRIEFKVNRTGLSLMILAVVIRIYLNFFV